MLSIVHRAFHPRSHGAYALLIFIGGGITIAIGSGWFGWDRPLFADALLPIAAGVAGCWLVRARDMGRWAAPIEMSLLLMAAMFLMAFGGVMAASTAAPMMDATLRRADAWMFGFDRDSLAAVAMTSPTFMRVSGWIYLSLGWTPPMIFALLVLDHREDRAWSLLTAMLITLVLCVACLAFFPAYGSPPYAYKFVDVLDGVRSGAMRRFDDSVITGLVTFPSMHAAYGLILAKAAMLAGRWAWPLAALNFAMIISALIIGGHYLVDIVAGCGVAVITMRVARLR